MITFSQVIRYLLFLAMSPSLPPLLKYQTSKRGWIMMNAGAVVGDNPAAVALPVAFPSPHVGGGDDATAWTGGPHVGLVWRLARPSSTMARRPTDFKIRQLHRTHRHEGPSVRSTHRTRREDLKGYPHVLGQFHPLLHGGAGARYHLLCL
jgi:hypothetical protein